MNSKLAKIEAQRILLYKRKRAFLKALSYNSLCALLLFGFFFCAGAALVLPNSHAVFENKVLLFLLIAAAVLLGILCLFGISAVQFRKARWFLSNAVRRKNIKMRRSRLYGKVFALFLFTGLFSVLQFLLYLLPFAIFSAYLAVSLTNGIQRNLFYILLAGNGLLLAAGLFFAFAAVQKYTLCRAALCAEPEKSIPDILKESKAAMDGHAFSCLRFRLSLLPWSFMSLLLFPAPFALPYTAQTKAVYSALLLREAAVSPIRQPSVLFLRLAEEN